MAIFLTDKSRVLVQGITGAEGGKHTRRMVASGASPGLTVAGLRFGDDVIVMLRPAAAQAGVVLEPLFRTDETGCDVHVRRADG